MENVLVVGHGKEIPRHLVLSFCIYKDAQSRNENLYRLACLQKESFIAHERYIFGFLVEKGDELFCLPFFLAEKNGHFLESLSLGL